MVYESDYLFVVTSAVKRDTWHYYTYDKDTDNGDIHYIIKNKTGETKHASIPSFSVRNKQGEWKSVEYLGELDLKKYPLEDNYKSSVSINDYAFEDNYCIARMSVPVYDEDSVLGEPVEVLTSFFIISIHE